MLKVFVGLLLHGYRKVDSPHRSLSYIANLFSFIQSLNTRKENGDDMDNDNDIELMESRSQMMQKEGYLRSIEERLRLCQSYGGIGSWERDLENNSLYWSENMYDLLGITKNNNPTFEAFLEAVCIEDRKRLSDILRLHLDEGKPFNVDYRIAKDNGIQRWIRAIGKAEYDLNGKPLRMRGIILDVTEQKIVEKELNKSLYQLEAKEQSKTRFLAAAGHDLRQPIAAANMIVETLKRTPLTQRQTDLFKRLDQSMGIFSNMLDRLLDISKFDAGLVNTEITSFDLVDILLLMEQSFSTAARAKQLSFRLFFPLNKPLVVSSDIDLLQSVLMNLLSNAIKFTEEGGILVSARLRGNHVLIQIWDTGIGITDTDLPHVFDEFFQVDNAHRDREKGLGLGLSICQRAMSLLKVNITCRSRPGRGSVFEMQLPLDREQREIEPVSHNVASPRDKHLIQFKGKSFVVVEDDELVADATISWLHEMGGKVKYFSNADDALRYASIDDDEYYLVDYMLGGTLNGMQFLKLLRQKLGRPVKAVIMTGDTSTASVREAAKCDWPVLHKPVNVSKLIAVLGEQENKDFA